MWVCESGKWEQGRVCASAFNQHIWYCKSKACCQSNRLDYQSLRLTKCSSLKGANWRACHPQVNCLFFFSFKEKNKKLHEPKHSIRKYSFKSLSKAIFCITNQRVLFGPPSSISICLSFLPCSCVILSSVSFLLPLARRRSPVLSVFCLKVGRLIVEPWWRPATLLHRVLCWQPGLLLQRRHKPQSVVCLWNTCIWVYFPRHTAYYCLSFSSVCM